MRNLFYQLSDGTLVRTLVGAKASGQKYKMVLHDVPKAHPTTDKWKQMYQ